jgi:hypothetical protein
MPAGGGDFHGAPHMLLSFYLAEIEFPGRRLIPSAIFVTRCVADRFGSPGVKLLVRRNGATSRICNRNDPGVGPGMLECIINGFCEAHIGPI